MHADYTSDLHLQGIQRHLTESTGQRNICLGQDNDLETKSGSKPKGLLLKRLWTLVVLLKAIATIFASFMAISVVNILSIHEAI